MASHRINCYAVRAELAALERLDNVDPRLKVQLRLGYGCYLEGCGYISFPTYELLEAHCMQKHLHAHIPEELGMCIARCHHCDMFCPRDRQLAASTCADCRPALYAAYMRDFKRDNPEISLTTTLEFQLADALDNIQFKIHRKKHLNKLLRLAEGSSPLFTTNMDLAMARATNPPPPPPPSIPKAIQEAGQYLIGPIPIQNQRPLLPGFECTFFMECRQRDSFVNFQGLLSHWLTKHAGYQPDPRRHSMRITQCNRCGKLCLRTALQEIYLCDKCKCAPRKPPKIKTGSQQQSAQSTQPTQILDDSQSYLGQQHEDAFSQMHASPMSMLPSLPDIASLLQQQSYQEDWHSVDDDLSSSYQDYMAVIQASESNQASRPSPDRRPQSQQQQQQQQASSPTLIHSQSQLQVSPRSYAQVLGQSSSSSSQRSQHSQQLSSNQRHSIQSSQIHPTSPSPDRRESANQLAQNSHFPLPGPTFGSNLHESDHDDHGTEDLLQNLGDNVWDDFSSPVHSRLEFSPTPPPPMETHSNVRQDTANELAPVTLSSNIDNHAITNAADSTEGDLDKDSHHANTTDSSNAWNRLAKEVSTEITQDTISSATSQTTSSKSKWRSTTMPKKSQSESVTSTSQSTTSDQTASKRKSKASDGSACAPNDASAKPTTSSSSNRSSPVLAGVIRTSAEISPPQQPQAKRPRAFISNSETASQNGDQMPGHPTTNPSGLPTSNPLPPSKPSIVAAIPTQASTSPNVFVPDTLSSTTDTATTTTHTSDSCTSKSVTSVVPSTPQDSIASSAQVQSHEPSSAVENSSTPNRCPTAGVDQTGTTTTATTATNRRPARTKSKANGATTVTTTTNANAETSSHLNTNNSNVMTNVIAPVPQSTTPLPQPSKKRGKKKSGANPTIATNAITTVDATQQTTDPNYMPFKCKAPGCDMRFALDSHLFKHVITEHKKLEFVHLAVETIQDMGMTVCEICFEVFPGNVPRHKNCMLPHAQDIELITTNRLFRNNLAVSLLPRLYFGELAVIDPISWEQIWSTPKRILKYLPKSPTFLRAFCYITRLVLSQILQPPDSATEDEQERVWKLLFLIPWLFITIPASLPKGQKVIVEVSKRINLFLELKFEELFTLAIQTQPLQQHKQPRSGDHYGRAKKGAPNDQSSSAALKNRKILTQVKQGQIKNASATMSSETSIADITDGVIFKKLTSLYKSDPSILDDEPTLTETTGKFLVPRDVSEAVGKTGKSASGASGWTIEAIKRVTDSKIGLDFVTAMFNKILQQKCPPTVLAGLNTGLILTLVKPNGGVRPIVLTEAFGRLLSKSVGIREQAGIAASLAPLQTGVGLKAGIDLVVHVTRHLVQTNRDWVAIQADLTNAYGMSSRQAIRDQLRLLPKGEAELTAAYFDALVAPVKTIKSQQADTIIMADGLIQGDPLSPLLFALLLQPILLATKKKLSANPNQGDLFAYLDDVILIGPPNQVFAAFDEFTRQLLHVGLHINLDKTNVLSIRAPRKIVVPPTLPGAAPSIKSVGEVSPQLGDLCRQHHLRPPVSCITILGTPVGHPSEESKEAIKIVRAIPFDKLTQLSDHQHRMLLLRYTVSQSVNHLARCMPPSCVRAALTLHDRQVREVVLSCMEATPDQIDVVTDKEIGFPLACGGLGFPSLVDLSQIAYLSSIYSVLLTWQNHVPPSHPVIAAWCQQPPDNPQATTSATPTQQNQCFSLQHELQSAMKYCHDLAATATVSKQSRGKDTNDLNTLSSTDIYILNKMPSTVADLLQLKVPKLQANLTRFKVIGDLDQLQKAYLTTKEAKAQFLSKATSNSSLWLRAHPSEPGLTFSNKQFMTALRLYLRMPLLSKFGAPPNIPCHCKRTHKTGEQFRLTEAHLLNCQKGDLMNIRHKDMQECLCSLIRMTQLTATTEPGVLVPGADNRFDIDVPKYKGTNRDLKLDITITNPCTAHPLAAASKIPGATAAAKAQEKIKKYLPYCGQSEDFEPIVFETYGYMDERVPKLFHMLSERVNHVPPEEATWAAPTFKAYCGLKMSCLLWKDNADAAMTVIQCSKEVYQLSSRDRNAPEAYQYPTFYHSGEVPTFDTLDALSDDDDATAPTVPPTATVTRASESNPPSSIRTPQIESVAVSASSNATMLTNTQQPRPMMPPRQVPASTQPTTSTMQSNPTTNSILANAVLPQQNYSKNVSTARSSFRYTSPPSALQQQYTHASMPHPRATMCTSTTASTTFAIPTRTYQSANPRTRNISAVHSPPTRMSSIHTTGMTYRPMVTEPPYTYLFPPNLTSPHTPARSHYATTSTALLNRRPHGLLSKTPTSRPVAHIFPQDDIEQDDDDNDQHLVPVPLSIAAERRRAMHGSTTTTTPVVEDISSSSP